jgi:hypothetical protein
MRHLPVLRPRPHFDLDALEVETPCAVPWDSMQGDNRVRYCGHCRQKVYNIEALPRAEAVRLVGARQGTPCIRFYRRRDGTVVTADCWTRLRAARRRGLLAFAAVLVGVGAAQLYAMVTGLAGLEGIVFPRQACSADSPLPTGDAPWAKVLMGGAPASVAPEPEPKRTHLMGKRIVKPVPDQTIFMGRPGI